LQLLVAVRSELDGQGGDAVLKVGLRGGFGEGADVGHDREIALVEEVGEPGSGGGAKLWMEPPGLTGRVHAGVGLVCDVQRGHVAVIDGDRRARIEVVVAVRTPERDEQVVTVVAAFEEHADEAFVVARLLGRPGEREEGREGAKAAYGFKEGAATGRGAGGA